MSDHRHAPSRGEFSYWWPVTVRWGDMDALGHVNNTLYLQYLESARIGYFEAIEWGMDRFAAEGRAPIVVSQTFHYRRQVTYPAELEIGLRCGEIRQRSFVLECGVFRRGTEELVGHGSAVLAWTDLAAGRAVELPEEIRLRLTGPIPERAGFLPSEPKRHSSTAEHAERAEEPSGSEGFQSNSKGGERETSVPGVPDLS